MSRRRAAEKRTILPDHKFKDLILAKFMNRVMQDGKKSMSEQIVYGAFEKIKGANDSPIDVFNGALNNVKPSIEVRSRRVGGATYQVPIDIPENRRVALSMRWIISFARSRKGSSMVDKLSAELIAASKNEGSSIKKKEDTHKMAEANKAFAHFR